jgi:hypothetical protein
MNIILDYNQIEYKNIYFNEPIENTIINNGYFIKLIYSNNDIILNGIYLDLKLKIKSKDFFYKKIRFNFNYDDNANLINNLIKIEKNILSTYNSTKKHKLVVEKIFRENFIKVYPLFNNNSNNIIGELTQEKLRELDHSRFNNLVFKISGLWETSSEVGLTFKILIF